MRLESTITVVLKVLNLADLLSQQHIQIYPQFPLTNLVKKHSEAN